MKKLLMTTVAAISLAAAMIPAKADVRELAHFSYWHVYGGTTDRGTAMCGMSSSFYRSPADKARGIPWKTVQIKYYGDKIHVAALKDDWRFPEGAEASFSFGFDKDDWFGRSLNAPGEMYGRYGILSMWFDKTDIAVKLVETFAHADTMWVAFGGDEPTWTLNMEGSRDASKVFVDCVRRLPSARPATQPYSGPQASTGELPRPTR